MWASQVSVATIGSIYGGLTLDGRRKSVEPMSEPPERLRGGWLGARSIAKSDDLELALVS
jgi:hypothetical protein